MDKHYYHCFIGCSNGEGKFNHYLINKYYNMLYKFVENILELKKNTICLSIVSILK